MAKQAKPDVPESPWGLIVPGAVLSAVGGVGVYGGVWPFIALAWIGSVLTLAGIVGAGVTMGLLRADYIRQRR